MIFEKKGKWKHSLSAKKFLTRQEAQADYDALTEPQIEEAGKMWDEVQKQIEEECPICNGLECECELSPVEEMWKSVD